VTILVFTSVPGARESLADAVLEPGHDLIAVESAAQAVARLAGGVDLLIVDLATAEAVKFFRKHAARRGPAPILCVADRRRPDVSAEALRLGAVDIIARPIRRDDVTAAVANAREFARVARDPEAVPDAPELPEGVFGTSSAMRDVLAIVRRVAPSRCGVLVVGERGTGREMVARAIHAYGPRRDKPFFKIVCGAEWSAEFERLMNGGFPPGSTIYLEDLGELLPEAQILLEGSIRQESGKPETVAAAAAEPDNGTGSLRFVGSTVPRILDASMRGTVRASLLEAIAVVQIDLPQLRQRVQDIPLLALYFLKDACGRAAVPSKTFSRSALTLLAALPWTGNAAELRSLCERLAILIPRGIVLLEDVLANVRFDHTEALGRPRESLREARERFERDYITSVLQHHRGRMAEAARDLGVERTNLYRKIKQLNIRWITGS
jgi:two-component system response regulator AtoC